MLSRYLVAVASLIAIVASACGPEPTDYRYYLDHMPRSVLVIPPLNDSTEVKASDAFLSTITQPLAELGYYVFPIAVVDQMFKKNGVPTPGEMHQVSMNKLVEVFDPDAVLYIRIKEWTTTYVVIDTTSKVTLEFRLVDADGNKVMWNYEGQLAYSSSSGQSNIISMTVAAQVQAIMSLSGEYERKCADRLNDMVCADRRHGLLIGRYHPRFDRDQARVREAQAKLDRKLGRVGTSSN